jgi:hypothetical protein
MGDGTLDDIDHDEGLFTSIDAAKKAAQDQTDSRGLDEPFILEWDDETLHAEGYNGIYEILCFNADHIKEEWLDEWIREYVAQRLREAGPPPPLT